MVTGEKPDLSNLHEWGCPVWVHDKSKSKLEGRAREGRWMGFDEQSNGSRIYWPDKRTVTVERSVTFVSPVVVVDGLEGEDEAVPEHMVKLPSTPLELELEPLTVNDTQTATVPEVAPTARPQRIRKPTQYVRDLLDGHGSATGFASRPIIPTGLQAPTAMQIPKPEAVLKERRLPISFWSWTYMMLRHSNL
jgi:hypothetical protein